jgi:hypothetical protein
MNAPRLIVRVHDPSRTAVRIALVAVLVIVAAWAMFEMGRAAAEDDRRVARDAERAREEAAAVINDLRERLAVAERSGQVDRQAHEELRRTLDGLNGEILQLREELAFYRGIVSPSDARRGVRIHDLQIEGVGEAWRFRLMLIQAMQHDRQAQGRATLTVFGTAAGGPASFEVNTDGLAYDFRYFQGLDGDILLPQGFTPDRIEVVLQPRSERETAIQQTFDWPGAVNVGG